MSESADYILANIIALQKDTELFILLGAIALAFDAALVLLIVTGAL